MKLRFYKMALSKTFLGAETPKRKRKNLTRSDKAGRLQIALILVFICGIGTCCFTYNVPLFVASIVALLAALVLEGYRV